MARINIYALNGGRLNAAPARETVSMTYDQALTFIHGTPRFASKPGLTRITALMAELGDPQKRAPQFIHVAGTNGKGSTCAFIAAGLIQAGYKVGKFISPHVLDVTERITVNNTPIPREKIPPVGEKWFQSLWKLALEYFAEQNVDYAVIETGIGGLLDCTNKLGLPEYNGSLLVETARGRYIDLNTMFMPEISVITKIGYDHMDLLGNTIQEIAAHKAGIIKDGVPVVTDPTQLDGAMRVIEKTAEQKNAKLHIPTIGGETDSACYMECNAAIAAKALEILGVNKFDFSDVQLPARFQIISRTPLTIIDGAHNPDAIKAVLHKLEEYPQEKVVVFGMKETKDYNACINLLKQLSQEIIAVENVEDENEIRAAIQTARNSNKMILVIGSLYLAGPAIRYFNQLP
jgi:dihydrofolate synthase/folylpolyglutamate synthase